MVQCSIADEMQLVTLILFLCSCTKCIVNGNGMSKIEMKIINATCKGKSCDGFEFKLCYAKKGGVPKCLHTLTTNYEKVELQIFDNIPKHFEGIGLRVLPFYFIIFINDESLYKSEKRRQNGTTMDLELHSDTGTRSFIHLRLTSECYDAQHCTGFLCRNCYYDPPIVTVPKLKIGALGGNIIIPCNVSQLTNDTIIKWIKTDGSFSRTIYGSDLFRAGTFLLPSLTIITADLEDEGNYTCQAKNLNQEGYSHHVHLSIYEYPVVNVSNIEPAIEGTNITIPCYVSPTSEVINITWYKNNSILDIYGNDRFSGGTISSPSLEIYFVEENDEGNYTCQATNPGGTNKSVPTHLQVLSVQTTENVGMKQKDIPIVLTSKEEAVNIGDYVTLSCNISSVSELTKIVWSKNKIVFDLNRTKDDDRFSGGTLQDPSLTINSVQITDEGNYSCKATNAAEQTGWSKPVLLSVFEATTESLPTTDLIFTTSELSTPSSDIISTDFISPTSDLTTLISDTMPSTIETTNPNTVSSSVQTTIATNSANVPSTIETTKPSTVPSSIKTTIATTSTHVPSTKYSYSSSTRKPFDTASSTLTPTRKSTTTLFNSKPTNTVTSTVRPTTKHMSVSSSYNLPKHTTESKPPTQISYSSSTVKTSTTTSSTVDISTKTSSTSDSPVTSASAVGSTQNSENLNAWVITTTVICVVEFIVIVLVIYIMWLRKQRRLAMQYEKEETTF